MTVTISFCTATSTAGTRCGTPLDDDATCPVAERRHAVIPDIFGEQFHSEVERRANGEPPRACAVCGRGCGRKPVAHVLLSTNGYAMHQDNEGAPDDQGFFPVGATCAKRFPAGFLSDPMLAELPA